LAAILTAQAQSYYAEQYIKKSGKLNSKIWVSCENGNASYKMRSETFEVGFGLKNDGTSYNIIRVDSAKMFTLYPETKTYTYWDLSAVMKEGKLTSLINSNGGGGIMKDSRQDKKFLGTEVIEGYECNHYRYTITSTLANGTAATGYREAWVYEPLKIEMQWEDGGEVFVIRNLKQGAQPESLFEIPKDYKRESSDASEVLNMLDLMQGKGKAGEAMKQNQQNVQEQQKKNEAIKNDPNKSEQQKIMELLNQMGGSQKKK
jgi:hypothetical protein